MDSSFESIRIVVRSLLTTDEIVTYNFLKTAGFLKCTLLVYTQTWIESSQLG